MPKFKFPSIPTPSDLQIMCIGILGTVAVVGGAFTWTAVHYDKRGASRVQAAWDKSKAAYETLLAQTRNHYAWKMGINEQKTKEVEDDLKQAKLDYEADITRVAVTLRGRLQSSEQRAAEYQRAAQGSTSQRDDLASHAAKLDRTLEEGRGLVQELGATVRQRDKQLNLLGDQILADRELFENTGTGNGTAN